MKKKKIKVAITGGIGSGKSFVANLFNKAGYNVISADDIAKQILSNDEIVKEKIKKEFGPQAYSNGKPNIEFLSGKVFSVPENVKKINSIIHPAAIAKIETIINKLLKKQNIVFVEAALIFEANMQDLFDYIILLVSDEKKRIERVKKRSGLTGKEIALRMQNQIPDNVKRRKSHFIIENNSSLEDLTEKSLFILNLLKTITE